MLLINHQTVKPVLYIQSGVFISSLVTLNNVILVLCIKFNSYYPSEANSIASQGNTACKLSGYLLGTILGHYTYPHSLYGQFQLRVFGKIVSLLSNKLNNINKGYFTG